MATVTHLAEIRKDKLDAHANLLAHARIFVPGDLALDTEWRSKTHAAIEAAANESGLAAEVRDLLKEVLADTQIVETSTSSGALIARWLSTMVSSSLARTSSISIAGRSPTAPGAVGALYPIPATSGRACRS